MEEINLNPVNFEEIQGHSKAKNTKQSNSSRQPQRQPNKKPFANYLINKGLYFTVAVWTGLEPATPCVTGTYSNQTELPDRLYLRTP